MNSSAIAAGAEMVSASIAAAAVVNLFRDMIISRYMCVLMATPEPLKTVNSDRGFNLKSQIRRTSR
ncbi:MAG: hypothetical protein ACJAXK_002056 [Yoonia sp.]|jgi:hypothetical protein